MIAKKQFLIIAIATLITVLSWAVLDTVHKRTSTEVSIKWQDAAEPIDPNFDLGALDQ